MSHLKIIAFMSLFFLIAPNSSKAFSVGTNCKADILIFMIMGITAIVLLLVYFTRRPKSKTGLSFSLLTWLYFFRIVLESTNNPDLCDKGFDLSNLHRYLFGILIIVVISIFMYYLGYSIGRLFKSKHGSKEMKPFTLYTYYLLAIMATLIIPAVFLAIFPNVHDYLKVIVFPASFIGVLLIGYFKWYRYRKIKGLSGKDTVSHGIMSLPAGMVFNKEKDKSQSSDNKNLPLHLKEISNRVVLIIVLSLLVTFSILFDLYFR